MSCSRKLGVQVDLSTWRFFEASQRPPNFGDPKLLVVTQNCQGLECGVVLVPKDRCAGGRCRATYLLMYLLACSLLSM